MELDAGWLQTIAVIAGVVITLLAFRREGRKESQDKLDNIVSTLSGRLEDHEKGCKDERRRVWKKLSKLDKGQTEIKAMIKERK